MVNAVVLMVADHQNSLADHWMKRIGNHSFECQKPGTMAPARTKAAENWACLASLIETCKLNRVNPQAYFADLLTRLVNGWPQKRIDELMPWNWVPDQPP